MKTLPTQMDFLFSQPQLELKKPSAAAMKNVKTEVRAKKIPFQPSSFELEMDIVTPLDKGAYEVSKMLGAIDYELGKVHTLQNRVKHRRAKLEEVVEASLMAIEKIKDRMIHLENQLFQIA